LNAGICMVGKCCSGAQPGACVEPRGTAMPLDMIASETFEHTPGGVRPVILCGGSGTRLWPVSRTLHPKQLMPVTRAETMLQETIARTQHPMFGEPLIVSGEEHRFLVRDQIAEIDGSVDAIILEPQGRNTAAAIALAAYYALERDADEIMLVMPSDHVILDPEELRLSVAAALPAAETGALVTFGIEAKHPETGYGYIEAGDGLPDVPPARNVTRFVEKPDIETAEAFCASGNHFWNGGIFLFRADAFLEELRKFAPEIDSRCRIAMEARSVDDLFVRPFAEPFLACPAVSVDYAVLEKTGRACVVPVDMRWSDVGSWEAIWEIAPKDERSNAVQGDVVAIDTANCLLRSEGDVTVGAIGVEDLVVIATHDAVLIVPKERSQDTKLLVDRLKALGHDKHSVHRQVHRPWGSFETVARGDRFQTKQLIVKAGQKLSLQMHHQRSEHWIVVSGTARVTIDGRVSLLQENESTYVPAGSVHRIENPGRIPLHIIEVQCGPYLGEDDIIRFEDDYGRLPDVA
jgi:mannose-1-phosphate guanylyltransferase/mannose-6-phosphate isomerase